MAPEFYQNLKYHSSWSRLVLQFIFDKRYSLYSRVERMKELESAQPNGGGSACLQADVYSPKAQDKIPGGRAAIANALRTTRSTLRDSAAADTPSLDLSARPISF
jgi:hypothetical protein